MIEILSSDRSVKLQPISRVNRIDRASMSCRWTIKMKTIIKMTLRNWVAIIQMGWPNRQMDTWVSRIIRQINRSQIGEIRLSLARLHRSWVIRTARPLFTTSHQRNLLIQKLALRCWSQSSQSYEKRQNLKSRFMTKWLRRSLRHPSKVKNWDLRKQRPSLQILYHKVRNFFGALISSCM